MFSESHTHLMRTKRPTPKQIKRELETILKLKSINLLGTSLFSFLFSSRPLSPFTTKIMATQLAHSTPLYQDFETAHQMLEELDREESRLQQLKRELPLLDINQHRVMSNEINIVNNHRRKWKAMIRTLNRSLKQQN